MLKTRENFSLGKYLCGKIRLAVLLLFFCFRYFNQFHRILIRKLEKYKFALVVILGPNVFHAKTQWRNWKLVLWNFITKKMLSLFNQVRKRYAISWVKIVSVSQKGIFLLDQFYTVCYYVDPRHSTASDLARALKFWIYNAVGKIWETGSSII